jgi:hypothetical protein
MSNRARRAHTYALRRRLLPGPPTITITVRIPRMPKIPLLPGERRGRGVGCEAMSNGHHCHVDVQEVEFGTTYRAGCSVCDWRGPEHKALRGGVVTDAEAARNAKKDFRLHGDQPVVG